MSNFCNRCLRPTKRCVCGFVQPIDNPVPVIILQHHRERFHPKGTATLAALCLENSKVISGKAFHTELETLCLDYDLILLWPKAQDESLRETALDKERSKTELTDKTSPSTKPKALLVIDATWKKANKIYLSHSALHALPHLNIEQQENHYHHRKSPSDQHLSTLEAIHYGLQALDGFNTERYRPLLAAQAALVEAWQATQRHHQTD